MSISDIIMSSNGIQDVHYCPAGCSFVTIGVYSTDVVQCSNWGEPD